MALDPDAIESVIESTSRHLESRGSRPLSDGAKSAVRTWVTTNEAKLRLLRAKENWGAEAFSARLADALDGDELQPSEIQGRLDSCNCNVG